MNPLIVGLTGSFGSGCSMTAGYLESKKGFFRYRLSKPISEAAAKRGLNRNGRDRLEMQDIGDEMRKTNGPNYLARLAIEQIEKSRSDFIVLDGIRNIAEIAALSYSYPRFFLIGINADRDIRYQRVKDDLDRDEKLFDQQDMRDRNEHEEWGQQVKPCVDLADIIINNNKQVDTTTKEIEDFLNTIDTYLELMDEPGCNAPTSAELMMSIASNASLRSRCLKRKVGALPANSEDQVLAVGYNDPPVTEIPCLERYGLCNRERIREQRPITCAHCGTEQHEFTCENDDCRAPIDRRQLTGKELDHCMSLHAEENCVIQIARLGGPSPKGTTLYTTTFPCLLCAKKLAALEISSVVYIDPYPIEQAKDVLKNANVSIIPFEGVRARAFQRLYCKN